MSRRSSGLSIPAVALATFVGVYVLTPPRGGASVAVARTDHASAASFPSAADLANATYYPGCNAARAAGAAPIYRGQPGYREEMDGDGDGIACEPYRGLR